MNEYLGYTDDTALLAAFAVEATKEKAFTSLLKKYSERLYWHIRRMVVSHEDADDVLQNVSIKIWRGLGSFREDASLYTWLYRIATNESLSFIESRKKRATQHLDQGENFLSNKLVAEKGFDEKKIEWKLQQAIHALPTKQQLVFNLRYYDEMPYEQMSAVTATSVGALKASYHHAVKKVEAFIKGEF
ncbi:MAG: sigma-70 family RNA polymerase sigma factor [Chitinophagaceae bacterium]